MVEYTLLLNVIREKLEDEVWTVAKKLNHKLRDEDICEFVKMANLAICLNGYGQPIDIKLADELRAIVSDWKS